MNTPPTEPYHFDYESIEYALKMNILPQPCCPKTYFVPNDNEMDEEFEEDCPACKKSGYLERDYLEKLDIQYEEQKKIKELHKSFDQLTLSSNSSIESNFIKEDDDKIIEPFGKIISGVISDFMSSLFKPTFDNDESSESSESSDSKLVKRKLVKRKLVKSKSVKSKLEKSKLSKFKKYGLRKYKLNK
jgi:hypothetical protein